jgi:hypothetical protein
MIYAYLTVKNLFFRCCDPVNIKDTIESFTETKKRLHDIENPNEDNDEETKEETVVFYTKDMTGDPFAVLGVNIPSYYGGF